LALLWSTKALFYFNIKKKVSLTQIDLTFNAADLKIWEKFLKQTEVFVYAQ